MYPFSLYPFSLFLLSLSLSFSCFFFSSSSRYRVHPKEVNSNASDLDDDDAEEEESGEEDNGFGYQTSWGPVGYLRKDHCLQILVSEVVMLIILYTVIIITVYIYSSNFPWSCTALLSFIIITVRLILRVLSCSSIHWLPVSYTLNGSSMVRCFILVTWPFIFSLSSSLHHLHCLHSHQTQKHVRISACKS